MLGFCFGFIEILFYLIRSFAGGRTISNAEVSSPGTPNSLAVITRSYNYIIISVLFNRYISHTNTCAGAIAERGAHPPFEFPKCVSRDGCTSY